MKGLSKFCFSQLPHQGPLNIMLYSASISKVLVILLHPCSTHIRGLLICSIQHPRQGPLNILLHSASTSGAFQYSAPFTIHMRGPAILSLPSLTPTNPQQDARSVPRRLMKHCQHCKKRFAILKVSSVQWVYNLSYLFLFKYKFRVLTCALSQQVHIA